MEKRRGCVRKLVAICINGEKASRVMRSSFLHRFAERSYETRRKLTTSLKKSLKKKKTRSHSNSVHTVTTTTRANPESDDVIQRLGKTRNDDRRPQTSVSRFKHHKNKRRRSLATPLTDVVFKIRSSCKFTSTSMKRA